MMLHLNIIIEGKRRWNGSTRFTRIVPIMKSLNVLEHSGNLVCVIRSIKV